MVRDGDTGKMGKEEARGRIEEWKEGKGGDSCTQQQFSPLCSLVVV